MCDGVEAEVCVGAEGLTVFVNRTWLPLELMAINHPKPRNDRSYLELGLALWDSCLCLCNTLMLSVQMVHTLYRKHQKHQSHCVSDTPPPSCPCFHCDRWPCDFSLFLTPLPALHIRRRNSSAACKKELCVCGSRGHFFLRPGDSCSVGGKERLEMYEIHWNHKL